MKEKLFVAFFVFFFTLFLVSFQMFYLTQYEVISKTALQVLREQVNLEELDLIIKYACNMTDTLTLPIPGSNLTVPCSEINNSEQLIQKIFDYFYYKHYECGILDCYKLGEFNLLYYISNEANRIYYEATLVLLALSILCAVTFVVLSEDKKKAVGRLGISLISIALPLIIIAFAINYFVPFTIVGLQDIVLKINLTATIIGALMFAVSKLKL